VAAEVDPHAGHRVAGRGAADPPGALDERHAVAVAGGAVGGADAGRARPQDQQVGRGQPPAGTGAPSDAATGYAAVGAPRNSSDTRAPGACDGAPMTRERTHPPPSRATT
jgi:hypothetical protein